AQERRISLSIDAPESCPVEGDADKLQRIFLNLLSNAFKFTPEDGGISLELCTKGELVIVSIQDSGPGVKADLRDAIFERFRQGDGGAARQHGGIGLGLSIVKEFVELHGG